MTIGQLHAASAHLAKRAHELAESSSAEQFTGDELRAIAGLLGYGLALAVAHVELDKRITGLELRVDVLLASRQGEEGAS